MTFTTLSLRWQICALVVVALTASLLCTGWYAFQRSRDVITSLTLDRMMAQTVQVTDALDYLVTDARVDTVNTTRFPAIPGLIRCWDNEERPGWDDQQRGSNEAIWIRRLFQTVKGQMESYPERKSSTLYKANGQPVMQVAELLGGYSLKQNDIPAVTTEDYFQNAKRLSDGQVYISPMRVEGGQVVLRCCTPVYDFDEQENPKSIRAVFIIQLDGQALMSRAVTLLSDEHNGRDFAIQVADETGRYLYANRVVEGLVPFSKDRVEDLWPVRAKRLKERNPGGGFNPAHDHYKDLIQSQQRGGAGSVIATHQRIYYNQPEEMDRFWTVLATEPVETALLPLHELGRGFFLVGIAVLVTAGAFSYFASTLLTRSLQRLARAADHIAHGDLDLELPPSRAIGEVAALDSSFRVMSGNLRQNIAHLKHQEAHTQAILDSTADAIVTLSARGEVLNCNAATRQMFGLGDKPPGKGAALSPALEWEKLTPLSRSGELETEGLHENGSRFPMALRVTTMDDGDEQLFIATMQDITDRKRSEVERTQLFEAVKGAVRHLSDACQRILSTTSQQATGTHEQAAAVTETVATADEMSNSAHEAATRATELASEAKQTGETSSEGRKHVEDAVAAINEVRNQVETLADSIVTLAEQAQQIGNITATVNDIAEQTNVLALNAAVEASRAGEHGRGFAVVASEVKSLAEQSKKATSQVRAILGDIQQASNRAVMCTEQGTRAVSEASHIVRQAGDTIIALDQALRNSVRTATKIAAAVNQQASGSIQLSHGIKNIDRVTKENVLAIQQIETAAKSLSDLSTQLEAMMATGEFTI